MQPGQCGDKPSSVEPPSHHMWWVKTYCTHSSLGRCHYTTIPLHHCDLLQLLPPGKFTMYFPYILLLAALVLAGIERFFNKIFKSNIQVLRVAYYI